ncbi:MULTISPECIES: VOC family protein [unclassified Variovorax]|jgi:catechol 2,3-dioxygenase-like lactoylglutathione lyase family enzyme|uniref:VOC family protein n=1 Tax=unclassified Variovorax TaxID=663243 RepID=UPI0008EC9B62|nr:MULTISPECIES: VOC family protein [unclassified Variovorax]TAJ56531.1 MAG: glyoxalase [Variovorax sp.]SFO25584.1 Catechol 2,3-dioxygenase [Variovorax sp. PDC80]
MTIRKLDHCSIRTPDLAASLRFYVDILGLREGHRPPFDFPGAWLYRDGDQADYGVVHLIGIDRDHPEGLAAYLGDKPEAQLHGSGAIDHLAFLASGLAGMRARLRGAGLPFTERTVPAMGLHQLFVADPSGLTIELNYEAAEAVETR